MNHHYDIEEQWGQYIDIDYDNSKRNLHLQNNTTPYDVNKKYNPKLKTIKEDNCVMDRESIGLNKGWRYNHFIFGSICLSVIDVYFYACSVYKTFYKSFQ
tara:strand:- start:1826 stop:2125 length:300 start_codon:yes stop_codon:yes gene_type:complete